jgi:hypothetical protein
MGAAPPPFPGIAFAPRPACRVDIWQAERRLGLVFFSTVEPKQFELLRFPRRLPHRHDDFGRYSNSVVLTLPHCQPSTSRLLPFYHICDRFPTLSPTSSYQPSGTLIRWFRPTNARKRQITI